MKKIIFYTILLTAIICLPVSATIINVPDDYPTIQEGIDASTDGDTVLVQPGTYVENINFNGHNIVLGSLFLTTGDTTYISSTMIDGDSSGSVITFENGEDSTAVITGFTIRRGYVLYGGGIFCQNSNPTISGNHIDTNSAIYYGGGIYCDNSNPIISENTIVGNSSISGGGIHCRASSWPLIVNNIIIGNSASWGAGLYCLDSNPSIANNILRANLAAQNGGGIFCKRSSPTIAENSIIGNTAANEGGGIHCETDSDPRIIKNNIIENSSNLGGGVFCYFICDPHIAQNIIRANSASQQGGGIYCGHNSHPTITNNNISENYAGFQGGGIYCTVLSSPIITNTIFWADTASNDGNEIYIDSGNPSFAYSNIQGGWEGEGNIDVDPLFRDPENGDFHLMSTVCGNPYDSPCIDTGHPDILDSLLDCSWGLGTIRSDMGAYGGGDSVTVDIDYPDILSPEEFSISQNYPNPFNAMTVIRYSLSEPSDVIIEIYDILGCKVETLVQGEQPAGYHQAVWDAGDRSSGIYFCGIKAGDYIQIRKMVLIK